MWDQRLQPAVRQLHREWPHNASGTAEYYLYWSLTEQICGCVENLMGIVNPVLSQGFSVLFIVTFNTYNHDGTIQI